MTYGFVRSLMRGAILTSGSCGVEYDAQYGLIAFGRTIAAKVIDKVGYNIYYQKWNTTTERWVSLNPTAPVNNFKTNEISCAGYHAYNSTGKGKYRVQVDHYGYETGAREIMANNSTYVTVQ